MSASKFGIVVAAVSFLTLIYISLAQAQVQNSAWTGPYRLSSEEGKASAGYCTADPYGYVHCFWTETLFEDQRTIIQYSRFDGETWSMPNDIYVAEISITNVSPVVDHYGTLHVAWAEGIDGPAYYIHAPAHDALSSRGWSQPLQIDISARTVLLRIDSRDTYHILYNDQAQEPGVYYIRSMDEGMTWSDPQWLDPDILPTHIPDSLSFEVDQDGGLHAVWFYGSLTPSGRPDWVRYARSLDGGNTWSTPFTIDQYDAEREHNLTTASPVMTVSGSTVHVIWAAGTLPYRYHRFSTDAGQTWSAPSRLFGDLHGQAGDGLAVDGLGRIHFLGQIRYPVGIYHSVWDGARWSSPSLLYLIAQESIERGTGERIHAHGLNPVVRAGNQLVLTFADGPAEPTRRLFTMYRTFEDIAAREVLATPSPVSVPTAVPVSVQPAGQQAPTPTATAPFFAAAGPAPEAIPAPNHPLRVALLPTILLIGGTIATRLLFNAIRKRLPKQ